MNYSNKTQYLPNLVWKKIIENLGPGHYRFVGPTNQQVRRIYRETFSCNTSIESGLESKSRAKILLQEVLASPQEENDDGDDDGDNDEPIRVPIRVCKCATSKGKLEILQWLHKDPRYNLISGVNGNFFEAAALAGHLEVLKFTRGLYSTNAGRENTNTNAVDDYDFNVGAHSLQNECPWDARTCWAAARGGQLEVLQWLRSGADPCPWNQDTCSAAAEGGHLEVLKWLRSGEDPCPWNEYTCSAAALRGHLEVLEFARSGEDPCPWDERTCWAAVLGGHWGVLQWARNAPTPCPWDAEYCQWVAQRDGHLEIVHWVRLARGHVYHDGM